MIGIYKIVCNVNGRFYVGSSKDLESKLQTHKESLKAGTHYNTELQEDYNRFGETGFSAKLIKSFNYDVSNHILLKEEMEIIQESDPSITYNIQIKNKKPSKNKYKGNGSKSLCKLILSKSVFDVAHLKGICMEHKIKYTSILSTVDRLIKNGDLTKEGAKYRKTKKRKCHNHN